MSFQPVKSTRVFEEVSRQINGQILSGRLKAGEKLPNEREMAASFEVSRHAVREALRSLESIGQLELKKGATGGAFVAKANPQPLTKIMRGMVEIGGVTLAQLTEARLVIESAVIVACCSQTMDQKLLQKLLVPLEANVAEAERETLAGNLETKTRLNVEFHILLAELTGNPILIMMMKSMMSILLDFIREFGSVMGVDVIKSRRRFLKYLQSQNAEKAVQEMEQHLKVLHQHYIRASNKKMSKGSNR